MANERQESKQISSPRWIETWPWFTIISKGQPKKKDNSIDWNSQNLQKSSENAGYIRHFIAAI